MAGSSRTELVAWINDLIQPMRCNKIEECGKGYIYCQIVHSIHRDFKLKNVKWEPKTEPDYLHNLKLLQIFFVRKQINKPIPAEALAKCKMQDNLEFTQWMKKYWDMNFPGDEYDGGAERAAAGAAVVTKPTTLAPVGPSAIAPKRVTSSLSSGSAAARAKTPIGGPIGRTVPYAEHQELKKQHETLTASVDGLEQERNFYFSKLREIEILIEKELEQATDKQVSAVLQEVQTILYQTEDGFEPPPEEETF